jgi:cytochrome c553
MTKTRWIVAVVLAVLVLTLAGGIAYASGRPAAAAVPTRQSTATTAAVRACDQLHDSAAMAQMRAQMPAQAQQQHEAMHEQMEQTAGQMMSGGGMMNGYQASAQR